MSFETPPRPRWLLRVALAVGTVLVLVLGVVVVVEYMGRCAPEVAAQDGECVGVTDGSFRFSDQLSEVEGKIKEENDRIAEMPEVVTVAVLMPMTAEQGDSLSTSQIRDYLEGAHMAQRSANLGGHGLKVRLALANEGRNEFAWDQVTDQLVDMVDVPEKKVDAPENLVAVTGLGLSASETVYGARKLSEHGIPMVGYLSADGFNKTSDAFGAPIRTLTRVTPSLDAELAAVARHLDEVGAQPSKAILVHDDNPNDYYTADLRAGFMKHFYQAWNNNNRNSGPYTGGPDPYNLNIQFQDIASRLCGDDAPDTVLYAGRSNLLQRFVDEVRNRDCNPDRPITVVTGSEAADLRIDPRRDSAPVSVLYASVADPAALANPDSRYGGRYRNFQDELRKRFGNDVHESNWTVMGHDVTHTAAFAAQKSVGQEKIVPTVARVRDRLSLLNYQERSVSGVSGQFYLNADGDRVSGPIPVLRRSEPDRVVVEDLGGLGE